jgi:hypothetical protein
VIRQGTGSGTRLTEAKGSKGFESEYEIIDTDSDGNKSPKLKLTISSKSGYHNLMWVYNGETLYAGIGTESDHKLNAGWFETAADA